MWIMTKAWSIFLLQRLTQAMLGITLNVREKANRFLYSAKNVIWDVIFFVAIIWKMLVKCAVFQDTLELVLDGS